MKQFFFTVSFLIISACAFSQTEATTKDGKKVTLNANGTWMYADCAALLKTETYSGKTFICAKEDIKVSADGNKSGIKISLVKGPDGIILNFASFGNGTKCVVKSAPMVVEFTDGSKLTAKHMSDVNCNGDFVCFLGANLGTVKELEAFKTKKIKNVSIEYTRTQNSDIIKESDLYVLNDKQAEVFMKTVQCLSNL